MHTTTTAAAITTSRELYQKSIQRSMMIYGLPQPQAYTFAQG